MATQKGRNWSSGDIVTAANLSSIERGVSEVAEEYTPTTWANGDTVTAAGLNNIEQGIVNAGGGGSSDFSTATVTVTNSSGSAFIGSGCQFSDELNMSLGDIYLEGNDGVINLILYKGSAVISLPNGIYKNAVALSGDIEADDDTPEESKYWGFIVTGDCTITISDSSGGTMV